MLRSFRAGHGVRNTVAPSGSVSSCAARRRSCDAGYIENAPAASSLLFMSNLAPDHGSNPCQGALERASKRDLDHDRVRLAQITGLWQARLAGALLLAVKALKRPDEG